MRTLISQRTGDNNTPVNRVRNPVFDTPFRSAAPGADNNLNFSTLDSLISDAEGSLSRGIFNCENLTASLDEVPSVLAEVGSFLLSDRQCIDTDPENQGT